MLVREGLEQPAPALALDAAAHAQDGRAHKDVQGQARVPLAHCRCWCQCRSPPASSSCRHGTCPWPGGATRGCTHQQQCRTGCGPC